MHNMFIGKSVLLWNIVKLLCLCAFSFGYNTRYELYGGTPGKKVQTVNVLNSTAVRSKAECCVQCTFITDCNSASYQLSTKMCLLSNLILTELRYEGGDDADWTTYSRNDWLLIFRAPAGIGGDLFLSYSNGVSVTTTDVSCMDVTSTTCTSNYRHPIIDSWVTSGISQIRYSLYKGQTEVAYIEFNGTGSDKLSWFSKDNVLDSTWTSIATDNYNYFSLEGYGTGRRFYINLNFGGCPADRMYMVAITWNEFGCSFDSQTSYPQFIYANTASAGYPESSTGTDYADFIAIFVKS